jgi:hypothetical protein
VEITGIYEVQHYGMDYDKHEVVCVAGESFPPCTHCGNQPRFVPIWAARHISSHEFFDRAH